MKHHRIELDERLGILVVGVLEKILWDYKPSPNWLMDKMELEYAAKDLEIPKGDLFSARTRWVKLFAS